MPTQYLHRVYIVAAASSITNAFRTFWTGQIDAADDPANWPALSATGAAPATARHWCGSLTNGAAKKVLDKWYQAASMVAPDWTTMTRAQIRNQLATDRAALVAATNIRMWHCDNDGGWDDFGALLAGAGLQAIQTLT